MKPSADAGHRCDFDEESPGVRLAINHDVNVGSPGVSLAVNVDVNVAIDVEVVYTGNNEVDQMKREQCMTMRCNLQGVKEDFNDASPSSKMRCTRFQACEVDDDKSRECMLAVEDEVDKKSLRQETTKRVCGPSKESTRL